ESKIRAEKKKNRLKEEASGETSEAAAGENNGKGGTTAKRKRCGNCAGCRAKACDRCKYCLDSKKNNGPNKLRQPCIKRRCRNMPGDAIDWAEAFLPDRGENTQAEGECEYCCKRDKELCSPMVYDLNAEEAEEFLNAQEAEYTENNGGGNSEGAHRKVRFPRFQKVKLRSTASSTRDSGPVVHEVCAQSMFRARAERAQHKMRALGEQAVEEAIRLGGYRTLPLGRDRHGRFYFRFAGDPKRVFVTHKIQKGDEEGQNSRGSEDSTMDVDGGDDKQTQHPHRLPPPPLLSKNPPPKDLAVYQTEADIRALIAWLNESGQREGYLRAALLRAFPWSQTSQSPMDEGETTGEASSGGGGSKEKSSTGAAGGEASGGGTASVTDGRRRGRGGNGSGEPRVTLAHPKRSQELPQLLAEGKVELRMAVNPPGAHGNVMMPASEAVVEFENDAAA
ncbi:unnamed protein product, partial [Sphacelaria rigidula]